ncbi:MAG: DNA recombination protein RmuC [Candidatus Hodarchaeota archaeon]
MDIGIVLVVLISAGFLAAFIYFLFSSRLQALQEIGSSANKLEVTVNTIQNLSSGFLEHLNSMRTMQENLDGRVSTLFDVLAMKPSARGGIGEGIVRFIIGALPETCWCEKPNITGIEGQMDFALLIPPDNKILPLDSKFTLPKDLHEEGELIFLEKEQRQKLNREITKRSKEVTKYISPSNGTMDFAMMFIPDAVYNGLDQDTLNELRIQKGVPVNTSGLLATAFLIEQQHTFVQINEAAQRLGEIYSTLKNVFNKLRNILKGTDKNIRLASKKVTEMQEALGNSWRQISVIIEAGAELE